MTYDAEPGLRAAEDTLVKLLADVLSAEARAGSEPGAPPGALTGLLAGLERLERRHASLVKPSPAAVELAGRVVRSRAAPDRAAAVPDEDALARRLAMQLLLTARAATPDVVDVALSDPDVQVRRLAAIGLGREDPLRTDALGRALRDPSGAVRYGALSQLGRREAVTLTVLCDAVLDRTLDDDSHVALLAIDLAAGCMGSSRAAATLASDVDRLPVEDARSAGARPRWHRAAHALVALAALAPDRARAPIARFAGDATWQVRMYAARAAAVAGEWSTLARLARDPHDNVREAAIGGWLAKRPRDADGVALEALARDDYQLLITAAKALEGTPRRQEARDGLFDALDRVTRQQRETSRDARRAIIERLGELGEPGDAARLEPYLSDFDPALASDAASLLGRWTGRSPTATPRLLPRLPLPTPDELARLPDTRVVLHLRGLGEVELRMLAHDAPLNAFRFVRLASAGYYDGLTFHRVAPGFVIQGGSPGANEYSGDGPFTRDEIGASNRRGAVGLSTRGRDTGDAQFYVNLVDNNRLDEDYTVFAEVIRGMDLVDRVLEGDVIERAAVTRPGEEAKD